MGGKGCFGRELRIHGGKKALNQVTVSSRLKKKIVGATW